MWGRLWRKGSPPALGAATLENSPEGPQEVKNRADPGRGNPTSGYLSKGSELASLERSLGPVQGGEGAECQVSARGRGGKKVLVLTVDHDTLPTKKGILPFVTTWMELEGVRLRGGGRPRRTTTAESHSRSSQPSAPRRRPSGAGGRGGDVGRGVPTSRRRTARSQDGTHAAGLSLATPG